jgi:hypothetical protein
MRLRLIALPLILCATPAVAQPVDESVQLPRELSDPQLADRLTDAMVAMSRAFLGLPVGEVEAAIEGRQPTRADRRRTVRSETGMSDQELQATVEASRPAIKAGQRALMAAIPAMMKGLKDAQRELEGAAANMPQPGYPKR